MTDSPIFGGHYVTYVSKLLIIKKENKKAYAIEDTINF